MDLEVAKPPTVLEPVAQSLANVYAQALLGLVEDTDAARHLCAELTDLITLIDEIPGASDLLRTQLISKDDRLAMIQKIFEGRLSQVAEGLVMVMARHGRLELLSGVRTRFCHLLNTREGIIEVQVTSAAPLDQQQLDRITAYLRQATGKEPLLSTSVDESLVGGVKVRIGDLVYDASVAASLKKIEKELIAKAATL
jgi:F-type H+-transporting ATPase subunit delta